MSSFSYLVYSVSLLFLLLGNGISFVSISDITLTPQKIIVIAYIPSAILCLLNWKKLHNLVKSLIVSQAALLFYAIFTLLYSANTAEALKDISYIALNILVFVISARITIYTRLRPEQILQSLALVVLILGVGGLYEIFFYEHIFSPDDEIKLGANIRMIEEIGWNVPFFHEGNPNNYAMFNVLFFLLIQSMMVELYKILTRNALIMVIVSLLILLFLIAASGSRAAIGSLLIALSLQFILLAKFHWRSNYKTIFLTLIVSTIGVTLLYLIAINFNLIEYIANKNVSEGDYGMGVRSVYYNNALHSFFDSTGFGSGGGSYLIFNNGANYHNHFLQILADYGLIGISAQCIFFYCIYSYSIKKTVPNFFKSGILSTLLIFPILSFGPSDFISQSSIWVWFGLVAGLLVIMNKCGIKIAHSYISK